MQHELLLLLSSHPSPLLHHDLPPSLLHPGELTTLHRLSHLSSLHSRLATFSTSRHASSSLAALGSVLKRRVVGPYTDKVLELETMMLKSRTRDGEGMGVPLAMVVAEMGAWEGLLIGAGRLLDELERPDGEGDGEGGIKWTAAALLTVLQRHSNTGLVPLAELLKECITAVASLWMASLTSFIVWGRVGHEPLVSVSLSASLTPDLSNTTYTFPPSSLPHLPNLSNPATRTALLNSLSTICLALSVLGSLPDSSAAEMGRSIKTKTNLLNLNRRVNGGGGSELEPVELSRPLRQKIAAILEGCEGPMDEYFSRRIASIEDLLSTHLLTLHLPTHLLTTTLSDLSSLYFLRAGSFASNLLSEMSLLRSKTARVLRGKGIGNLELAGVLARAVVGTELDDEADAESTGETGRVGMDAFKLVVGAEGEGGQAEERQRLSARLLGPELRLVFEPTAALGLVFSKDVMEVYQTVWGYLLAVRNCHSRLLTTWASLAHSHRLRRRYTSTSEGGLAPAEAELRDSAVRRTWTLVRSMIWWIETMERHFQTDVVEPGLRGLLGRIGGDAEPQWDGDEDEKDLEGEFDTRTETGASTATGRRSAREDEGEKNKKRLDFTSLTTLHSLYLSVITSGLLLNSAVLSAKMVEMMDVAEEFCGRVMRWGGDVLPGLLEGSLNAEESAQLVWERSEVVEEVHEQFSTHLNTFFELLSSASTNPHRPTHPDTSLSYSQSHPNVSSSFLHLPNLRSVLPKSTTPSSSSSSSSLKQNPVVAQARAEAESAARDFLPQLLLRLDFQKWFSLAGEREQRRREREGDVLGGLGLGE